MLKLSNYYKSTPKKIRKLADAILAASTFVSMSSIIANYSWLAITSLLLGALAKFLSNFFADDNSDT